MTLLFCPPTPTPFPLLPNAIHSSIASHMIYSVSTLSRCCEGVESDSGENERKVKMDSK